MPAARIRGTEIAWTEWGAGDVILFLHGFPFDARLWTPQLSALPEGWRAVAPDLRGFGRSPAGAAGSLAMDDHAADLLALLDHLGADRAVVCGLSMGGYIALALHRLAPERVRALVLADTRAEPDSREARRQRAQQAASIRAEGPWSFAEGMLPKLLTPAARHGPARQLVETMMRETPPDTLMAALMALAERPDARPQLPRIQVPTLVMGGALDEITPPPTLEALAAAIPGARLVLLDGAGHVSNLEAETEFNRELCSFLGSLPA